MKNIYLFHVVDEYVDYLRNYGDKNVLFHVHSDYRHKRVYVGPFVIENIAFYAPFSSIKNHDLIQLEHGIQVKPNSPIAHRIVDDRGHIISKIKFSHMLPVPPQFLKKFYINEMDPEDPYYKKLSFLAFYSKKNSYDLLNNAMSAFYQKLYWQDYPKIIDIHKLKTMSLDYPKYLDKYVSEEPAKPMAKKGIIIDFEPENR